MFLDLHEGVLLEFAEHEARRWVDHEDGLRVMGWPARERQVTAKDFPRLEREARLAFAHLEHKGAWERRRDRHARLVEQRRARGPQRVGDVSRGVARRADPAYRQRERVRQARAARERRRRAREASSSS